MKLRTQFTSLMVIFCIIFTSIGISAWYTNQQIAKINEQEQIANNIVKDAYQLSYLSNDYLFHIGETRQNLQWESKYKGLTDDIARLDVNNPEQQALVDQIKGNQLRLREVYTQSVATIEASQSVPGKPVDPELVQVAWSRFIVQNQGMIFDASQLSLMLHVESDQLQRTNTIITFSLMGVFLFILVILFLFINRRVLDSISSLQEGTKILGSGNLEHQITYQGDDEIGELSDDFNRMARNLKSVTASKSDLEKEITEREKAEESAKESLELYQTLSESAKDVIFICDPAGNLHYFNKNGAAVFGLGVDDLIGKTLEQAFPPEIAGEQRRQLDLVLESKKPLFTEINILLPNINLWLDVQLIPIFTEHGTIKSVMGVARDITPRKLLEKTLRISEERFRALFEEALDGICLADAKTGIIIDCNQAMAAIVGRERAELIGQPQTILHPPYNNHLAVSPTFRNHLTEKRGQILETQVVTKTGIIRDVEIKANLLNIHGKEILQGIFRDITERKQAEDQLTEFNERFKNVARATNDIVWDWELKTNNLWWSDSIYTVFGYQHDDIEPTIESWYNRLHPEDRDRTVTSIHAVIDGGGLAWSGEYRFRKADSSYANIFDRGFVIRDNHGKAVRMIGAMLDITERKRAEEVLKNYSEKLEEMVSERTRELRDAQDQLVKKEKLAILGKLAGGVGHELRNPLGAIKNAAYFLDMALEKPDPDVKEMVELINKEVVRSEDIISSLLDFARPKTLTLRKESVNTVVNESLKRNPVPNHITVITNFDETLPFIQADPDKLLQVFNNIISNAFQAIPEGGKLTITSKQSGPEWVSIAFSDTGVGISAENMKKLFEPLFTTKIKGIGLGMVVTKTIVEAHGGHIDVQSQEGKGTTITVNLPMSGRKVE